MAVLIQMKRLSFPPANHESKRPQTGSAKQQGNNENRGKKWLMWLQKIIWPNHRRHHHHQKQRCSTSCCSTAQQKSRWLSVPSLPLATLAPSSPNLWLSTVRRSDNATRLPPPPPPPPSPRALDFQMNQITFWGDALKQQQQQLRPVVSTYRNSTSSAIYFHCFETQWGALWWRVHDDGPSTTKKTKKTKPMHSSSTSSS